MAIHAFINSAFLCAVTLLLVLQTSSLVTAVVGNHGDASGERLVLSHSLLSLLNEVPGVWTAQAITDDSGEETTIDFGELHLERHSSSSVTLTIPAAPAAGVAAAKGGRTFNTVSCEEYKHSKGRCFFLRVDTEGSAGSDDEIYFEYVVKRANQVSSTKAVNAASNKREEEADADGGGLPAPRRHRRRRPTAAPSEATDGAAPVASTHSSAPLLQLTSVEEDELQHDEQESKAAQVIGRVARDAEELHGDDIGTGAKDYTLRLVFTLDSTGKASGGQSLPAGLVFPRVLSLHGVTGNVQQRLAAVQKMEKLRRASTFYGQWLSPLVYLAGLYGVLWVTKAVMDHRARRQENEKIAKARQVAAAAADAAKPKASAEK